MNTPQSLLSVTVELGIAGVGYSISINKHGRANQHSLFHLKPKQVHTSMWNLVKSAIFQRKVTALHM